MIGAEIDRTGLIPVHTQYYLNHLEPNPFKPLFILVCWIKKHNWKADKFFDMRPAKINQITTRDICSRCSRTRWIDWKAPLTLIK